MTQVCGLTLAELQCDLLHVVVVQVLLHHVALVLYAVLNFRRDIRDQPRHEELHHEHHMLGGGTKIVSDTNLHYVNHDFKK